MSIRTINCADARNVATGKRTELLKVRLTFDELVLLDTAASERQMDRSTWVRQALLHQAAREATYRPLPPLQLDPKDVAIFKMAKVRNAEAEEDKANG